MAGGRVLGDRGVAEEEVEEAVAAVEGDTEEDEMVGGSAGAGETQRSLRGFHLSHPARIFGSSGVYVWHGNTEGAWWKQIRMISLYAYVRIEICI